MSDGPPDVLPIIRVMHVADFEQERYGRDRSTGEASDIDVGEKEIGVGESLVSEGSLNCDPSVDIEVDHVEIFFPATASMDAR